MVQPQDKSITEKLQKSERELLRVAEKLEALRKNIRRQPISNNLKQN